MFPPRMSLCLKGFGIKSYSRITGIQCEILHSDMIAILSEHAETMDSIFATGRDQPAALFKQPARSSKATGGRPKGRIMGFGDLHEGDEDSDEDESNEYYTGGEKSGMVMLICHSKMCITLPWPET